MLNLNGPACCCPADTFLLLQELADSFSVTQLPSVVLIKDCAEVHRITSRLPLATVVNSWVCAAVQHQDAVHSFLPLQLPMPFTITCYQLWSRCTYRGHAARAACTGAVCHAVTLRRLLTQAPDKGYISGYQAVSA